MVEMFDHLYSKLLKQRVSLSKYYEYYKGNHAILNEYKPVYKAKNKPEVHNFCKVIIDNNIGYLLGVQPNIQYSDSDSSYSIVDVYNDKLGSYISRENTALMKYQQVFGYAFEINYIDSDGEFAVTAFHPLEMAVKRRGKKVVYGLYYKGTDGDVEMYDLFDVTGNMIYIIHRQKNGGKLSIHKTIKNVINNPIIYVKNNDEELSELKDIVGLNDAYNLVSTDATAEISQNRNSYLAISGAKLTEPVLAEMNASGIMSFPEHTDVGFVTKQVNNEFIDNKLSQLKNQIYTISGNVDFNDIDVGSNTSSLALRNKLITLNNKLSTLEGFLVEGMLMRFKNLAEYIRSTKVDGVDEDMIDHRKVSIKFIKNVPTSGKETAETVTLLYKAGLLSRESAIATTGIVDDPTVEMEKIDQEFSMEVSREVAELFGERVSELSGDRGD